MEKPRRLGMLMHDLANPQPWGALPGVPESEFTQQLRSDAREQPVKKKSALGAAALRRRCRKKWRCISAEIDLRNYSISKASCAPIAF